MYPMDTDDDKIFLQTKKKMNMINSVLATYSQLDSALVQIILFQQGVKSQ